MRMPAPPRLNVGAPTTAVPGPKDWVLLVVFAFCAGSAFGAIRVAVESASPAVISASRTAIAALTLLLYARLTGREVPKILARNRLTSPWAYALVIGTFGYAIPQFLIPYAQESVASLLAGIYMAFMPMVVVVLAALIGGEPLTRAKLLGAGVGLAGVFVLFGPTALTGILTADAVAQGALLLAALSYGFSSVLMRRAPDVPARSFMGMALLCGAIVSAVPAMIWRGEGWPSAAGLAAIVYLGLVPTAVVAILIITIVRSAGAGFFSFGNYIVPLVAIGFGVLLFGEPLYPRYAAGLALILSGLLVAQPGQAATLMRVLRRRSSRADR